MPSRIVREGILTSLAVDKLSCGAEVFYRRMLNVVDDFGRYHGIPSLLRAAAFPLKIDKVLDKHIDQWIRECAAAGLLKHYVVDGLPYVEVAKFGKPRATESKYPAPPADANKCKQTQTSASKSTVVVVEDVVVSDVTTLVADATGVDKSPSNNGNGKPYPDEFEAFWSHYPRKVAKGAAFKVWKRLRKADREAAVDRVEWFAGCWRHNDPSGDRAAFIPHPATWLNARGWEDDEAAVELAARGR